MAVHDSLAAAVVCSVEDKVDQELLGLLPALRAPRSNLQTTLKEQDVSASGGVESVRLRKSLVVVQVAMTTMLRHSAGELKE